MNELPELNNGTDAQSNILKVRRMGVDTRQEAVVFMREDCHVCRSEGFNARSRVRLSNGPHTVIGTLYHVTSDILHAGEAGLSESAWHRLGLREGDSIAVSHPNPVDSLSLVRAKVYGHPLDPAAIRAIIGDVTAGRYSDIHLASMITAFSANPPDRGEITALTAAMADAGDRLEWDQDIVVDKHCVGGLPGNRTTPIIVAIAAACGLTMPKTSSRAITSPAGTADTMETLAPVDLDIPAMRRVVDQEGGCVVWGGAVRLSPADDILISVERALDLDSEGQLVASVLSKKIAAGATHLILDIPVGSTAKVRDVDSAQSLSRTLVEVAQGFGVKARAILTDGTQPVGRGVGPALEARDVLGVLRNDGDAPVDLRQRALDLAALLLEMGGAAPEGEGILLAQSVLGDGRALAKFQAICEAQGGIRTPPVAEYQTIVIAPVEGQVTAFDNRRVARIAKMAGAPHARAAGLEVHVRLGDPVGAGQPLYTIHAESPGELQYALDYANARADAIVLSAP